MKYRLLLLLCSVVPGCFAQQQTYDILTFTPPKGWSTSTFENTIGFTITDNTNRTWAKISIVKSTTSQGSIEKDFESEWKDLVVKPYGVSEKPLATEQQLVKGWHVLSGSGNFIFNNETANVLLTTFSNGDRCASFIMMSNTSAYGKILEEFIASIDLPQTSTQSPTPQVQAITSGPETVATPVSDGFKFNTTNFDDGWTSVVKEDWVEATNGNVRVLLHYPREEDNEYISQQVDRTKRFWNLLVAPRYISGANFFFYDYNNSFEPAHFAHAMLTDKDGKTQFVSLFSKGKIGWIEVITPDKNTFVNRFGVDQPDSFFSQWDALVNLSALNRFAIGQEDLKGKWSSDFSGSTQYYNSYTGLYAGYSAYQSRQSFTFGDGNSYRWKVVGAQSVNGATQVQQDESSGTFRLIGNWQIYFSKIGKGPSTYDAYFQAVKGGRLLNLSMTDYPGYTAYGKVKE